MQGNISPKATGKPLRSLVLIFLALTASVLLPVPPVLAQTTSTWSGGSGNWSDCPPSGTALWDTCSNVPPEFRVLSATVHDLSRPTLVSLGSRLAGD